MINTTFKVLPQVSVDHMFAPLFKTSLNKDLIYENITNTVSCKFSISAINRL